MPLSHPVHGYGKVYQDFYSKISKNNGISNSFLMNCIWNARSMMQDSKVYNNKKSSENNCYKDLDLFKESFIKAEIWALKMLDATSNFQSGFLKGNIINLGDFKECLAIGQEYHVTEDQSHDINKQSYGIGEQFHQEQYYSVTGEQFHNIKGQYCMVTFYTSQSKFVPFVAQHYNIQSGLCVPSSCSVHNVTVLLQNGLQELGRRFYFSVDDCETSRSLRPKIGAVEIGVLWFLVLLSSTLFIATVADILISYGNSKIQIHVKKSDGETRKLKVFQRVLLKFSVKLNLKRFLESDNRKDCIGCIQGLRFISACMILSIHRVITDPQPFTNLFELDNEVRKWYRLIQMNAYLFVDVFFLISGLLVSYNFTKNLRLNFFHFFIHRYLRLTPPLLVCIFLTLLLDMVCDGPYCNSINRLAKEQCLNNSVYNLFYINNLINSSESCLPHTWYLAADMQLYSISFLLLIFVRNHPQHIYKILTAYWLSSVLVTFGVSYVNQIHAGFIGTSNSYEVDSLLLYEQFYTRAAPWVIGFALGLMLRNSHQFQLGKANTTIGWALSLLCLFTAYFGVYPFVQYGFEHEAIVDSLYNTFSHSLFALGIGWVIYACHRGYGGFVNVYLSSDAFQRLSKITYCFYLVHPLVQAWQYSQIVSPRTYSDLSQISLLLGDILYSIIFAAILHIAVEAPIANIDESIWKKLNRETISEKLHTQ
ncbi:hypothetical protein LSTR_LSTR011984 [Laodelphax striatellus]|uniref:Nose resistant-to-fluoxetine protein N-terminal domain-containing protein n=1 Tax=Laodelphax striatellus TaxID=195883 RepID=A0A482X0D0_LAOST|nr:hypothetical protein LSTR_LSTR011984 [Laodelphax striatellus]